MGTSLIPDVPMLISEAPMFELHPRLQADTRILGDLPLCRVLLAKDSLSLIHI